MSGLAGDREPGLVAEVHDMLRDLDPVPAGVRDAALMAGTLLGVDWERVDLAEVPVPVMRGAVRVWARDPDITVQLGDEVTGVVAPALGVTHVDVQCAAGGGRLAVDERGSFGGPGVVGRVRFVLHRTGAGPLVTPWLG